MDGCYPMGVFKSTDGGGTWSWNIDPGSVTALAIDPQTPTTVYAGGSGVCGMYGCDQGGVFKSTKSGVSWTAPP